LSIYNTSEQLYRGLKLLFDQIYSRDPNTGSALYQSNLIIRLRLTNPEAELVINSRKNPPQISYGGAAALMPDLNVEMTADIFHYVMMAELPLGQAIRGRQMKVRGPVWKSFVLEEIFHSGQAVYPQIVRSSGLVDLPE
jgi:hypothetical protein